MIDIRYSEILKRGFVFTMKKRTEARPLVKHINRQRCLFHTEMKQDRIGYLFLLSFLALFLVICAQDWLYLKQNISDDSAGEFLYMHKVWETGNPFTPAYSNSNELFASRPWFLYILFYPFTHSIVLSTKLMLIASTTLLVISGLYFFRKIECKWPSAFLAMTIFLGLIPLQTTGLAFRFINAYCMFYVGLFISLGIVADIEKDNKAGKIKYFVLFGMAIYFGLCGMRMLLCLYIPIFAFQLIRWINAKLNCKPYTTKKLLISGALLFTNFLGFIIYKRIITPYMHYNGEMDFYLSSSGNIWKDISTEFYTILQCLEINFNGDPVFSKNGIHTVYMIGTVAVLLYITCYMIKNSFFTQGEKAALGNLGFSGLILFSCGIISTWQIAGRYWIVLPTIVSLLFAIIYKFFTERKDMKLFRYALIFISLFGVALSSKEYYFYQTSQPSQFMQIEEHLMDQGVERIAGYYWHVSNIIFNSDGAISGMIVSTDDSLQAIDWISDRTQYKNDSDPITVILSPEEMTAWEESEKRNQLIDLAESVDEFAGYYFLNFEHNPFAFDLTKWGMEAKFNFLQLYTGEAARIENGRIILDQGGSQYGPYCALEAGDYDVTIRGENLEAGYFNACSALGAYEIENVACDGDTITYSIHLDDDAAGVELRCSNQTDEQIIVDDITVTHHDAKPIWE